MDKGLYNSKLLLHDIDWQKHHNTFITKEKLLFYNHIGSHCQPPLCLYWKTKRIFCHISHFVHVCLRVCWLASYPPLISMRSMTHRGWCKLSSTLLPQQTSLYAFVNSYQDHFEYRDVSSKVISSTLTAAHFTTYSTPCSRHPSHFDHHCSSSAIEASYQYRQSGQQ